MRLALSAPAWALALAPLVAVQALAGEISPEVDAAFARYAALPSKLLPVLAQAKSQESADAAAPALYELLAEVYDARSALRRIPSLSAEETQQVQQKYERQLRQDWGKLFEEIYRLQRTRCYESLPFFKQFQTLCLMLEK